MFRRVGNTLRHIFFVSDLRRQEVLGSTTAGSKANAIYYMLLGLSVLIAAFGLLANSPAVVIGAMLVSPLMTPIFGVSLGLVRADMKLLRLGLFSETAGVLLAIALPSLLGLLPLEFEVTPEILARTNPTLLDLMVATFAGLAGCLAVIDERISPVLPGIAIATSLTPPLAASGLCLALGSPHGAWGAFLLFFSNFLAILFVSSAVFIASGFVPRGVEINLRTMLKRYGPAFLCLLIVVWLLTDALVEVTRERFIWNTAKNLFENHFSSVNETEVERLHIAHADDGLQILAVIKASRPPTPQQISTAQHDLEEVLDQPIDLYVACNLTQYVAATGAEQLATGVNLDGQLAFTANPLTRRRILAEQIIREMLAHKPGLIISDVEIKRTPSGDVIIVTGQSLFKPLLADVREMEGALKERLGDDVRLLLRRVAIEDYTSNRHSYRLEIAETGQTPQDMAIAGRVMDELPPAIGALGTFSVGEVHAGRREGQMMAWATITGPIAPTPETIAALEANLTTAAGEPVKALLRFEPRGLISSDGYLNEAAFMQTLFPKIGEGQE